MNYQMKHFFLALIFMTFIFSCYMPTRKFDSTGLKKYGYYDLDFNDAWQIALAALHQKGKILHYNDAKGEIVVKIHKQEVRVHLKQVTQGTIEYKVFIVGKKWGNRAPMELVFTILESAFVKYKF